jgi:hypothetical protein
MQLPLKRLIHPHGQRLIGPLLAAAFVLASVAAPGASAGSSGGIISPCPGQSASQPFLPWLDPLSYVLLPNGGFESGSGSWTLRGGAEVVAGNESYAVRGSSDGFSVELPAGASATSSPMCVGTLYPTARLFVRNMGELIWTLRVEVLYKDLLGIQQAVPIGMLLGTRTWQPTLPLLLLANVTALPLLSNGATQVQLRFTAPRDGGGWQIDDIYVDPYMGR